MNFVQIDYNYVAYPSGDRVICWRDLPAIMRRPAVGSLQVAQQQQVRQATVGRCQIVADLAVADWSQDSLIRFQNYRSDYNMN
jgi:hypothetical protein